MKDNENLQFTRINKGQFVSKTPENEIHETESNDELKFREIIKENLSQNTINIVNQQREKIRTSSEKINGTKVTKKVSSNNEKTKKKEHKAGKIMAILLASYLLSASILATNKVNELYDVSYLASGSNLVTNNTNVPVGAYLEEFTKLLNPIELVEEASRKIGK